MDIFLASMQVEDMAEAEFANNWWGLRQTPLEQREEPLFSFGLRVLSTDVQPSRSAMSRFSLSL